MEEENRLLLLALIVMPDHLHSLVRLRQDTQLSDALRLFKGRMSPHLRQLNLRWQKGCFDHRLRDTEELAPVLRYMLMNPYRRGLLDTAEKLWPFWYCEPETYRWFQGIADDGKPFPEWLNRS